MVETPARTATSRILALPLRLFVSSDDRLGIFVVARSAGAHQTITLSNKQAVGVGWSNSVVTDIKIG